MRLFFKPRPVAAVLPASVADARLPGMTVDGEHAFLQWYAQYVYQGVGELVDLGCWMGATTISLARGLVNNVSAGAARRPIHAYDQFVWEDWMSPHVAGTPLENKYGPGESFYDRFLELTAPWNHRIQPHPGDLTQENWDGDRIEFLFIDVMKSWDLTNHLLKTFFPSLMPGRSIIVHQDFAHFYTSWIHLITYLFRDCFEPMFHINNTPSLVLKYCRQLPLDWLQKCYSFNSFTELEVEAAFAYSLELVPPELKHQVAAAHAMHHVHGGQLERARAKIASYKAAGLWREGALPASMISALEPQTAAA